MNKKNKKIGFGGILRRAVFIIALGVFLYAAYQLGSIYVEYRNGQVEYEDLRESFKLAKETEKSSADSHTDPPEKNNSEESASKIEKITTPVESGTGQPIPTYPAKEGPININGIALDTLLGAKYSFDFDRLRQVNPEVIAWIQIEGTNIDYPVVHAADNEKYLRLTVTGEWNNAGSIFADYRNKQPFQDRNTVIHGHNQRNHMMFHDLLNYEDKEYWKEHQYVGISTPDGAYYLYQIYAAYYTKSVSQTYFFDFESDAQYQVYLNYIKNQQEYDTGVPVVPGNKILTLSTCTNDWEDGRMVVHAKLINH